MSDTTMTGPVTYYYMPCPMCPASNPNYTGFQNCQGHAAPLVPAHNLLACPCCRAATDRLAKAEAEVARLREMLREVEERRDDALADYRDAHEERKRLREALEDIAGYGRSWPSNSALLANGDRLAWIAERARQALHPVVEAGGAEEEKP